MNILVSTLLSFLSTVTPQAGPPPSPAKPAIVAASSEACSFRCGHNSLFSSGCTLKAVQTNSCLYTGLRISGESVDCSKFNAEHGHLRDKVGNDPEE